MRLFDKEISLSTKLILELSLIFLLLGCATEDDFSIQLVEASITDLQTALLNGDASCREIVEGYMARIEN